MIKQIENIIHLDENINLDNFSINTKMSKDGSVIIISLAALDINNNDNINFFYIFRNTNEGYIREKKFLYKRYFDEAIHHNSIAISDDGNTIAMGRLASTIHNDLIIGTVTILKYKNGNWRTASTLYLDEDINHDKFGYCLDLSGNGKYLAVSYLTEYHLKPDRKGYVAIYTSVSGTWKCLYKVEPDSKDITNFGKAVKINVDGKRLFISANKTEEGKEITGIVNVYTRVDGVYNLKNIFESTDCENVRFGNSIDISSNGEHLIIGSPVSQCVKNLNTDKVYYHNFKDNKRKESIIHSNILPTGKIDINTFGKVVKISDNGNNILVLSVLNEGNARGKKSSYMYELFSKRTIGWYLEEARILSDKYIFGDVDIELAGEANLLSFIQFNRNTNSKNNFCINISNY